METMEELDDDFGDLYADVEAQVSSAINVVKKPKLFVEQEEDSITEKFKSSEGFAPHSKSCDSGEIEPSRKILGSEVNGDKEEVSLDNRSDSEDDLNIVLNYEDCQVFGVNGCVRSGGGDVENDSDDFVVTEGNDLPRNDKNGLEQSALKGSYYSQFSQYKYIRPHTGVFPSHAKGDGLASVASISSMVSRGDCEDNEGNQYKCSSSSPVAQIHASAVPKSGYGFLLPRRRTILDVNIDTFELKPWRHPGADVTDFFNFGFDEQSWKDYCCSVHEQVQQQTSMLTRIPVRECFNSDQIFEFGLEHLEMSHESMAVETAQAGQEGRDIPASEIASWGVRQIEMPKGRAIQVGGGVGERQSSMDVKRPRIQDSDVVIQITVQDTLENSSGSDKEGPDHKDSTLKEATQNGEFGRYDDRDHYSLDSASGDGLSPVFPENSIRTLDSPSAMRRYPQLASSSDPLSYDNRQNSQISDVERHHHQDVRSSRGNSEEMVLAINTEEEVGRDKCSKDPCITEKESASGGRTQYSPSLSHFESPSEASEDSLYTDQEEIQKPSRRPSRKSVTELRESDTSHFNLLKDSGRNNVRHHKNYARSKSPIQGRHMHRSWRPHGAAELKMNNDDGACVSFRPDEECLYDRDYSPVSHSKRKERFHNFGSYHEEDVSYYRKTKISLGHHGERFGHDYFRDAAEIRSDRKSPHRFRNELDPHMKKRWTERDDFLGRRITRLDDEISERDWNYRERGGAFKHIDYPVCRKSRQMGSMPSFHTDKGKNTQWRKRTDGHYSIKRNEVANPWLEHRHVDDFMHKTYGRAVPFTDRRRESLDDRYEIPLPYAGSNMESFKRDIYGDRLTSDRHLRSMGVEDDCWRHVDSYQLSSESYRASHTIDSGRWHDIVSPRDDVYHLKSTGRCGRRRKDMYAENHGDGDWFGSYYNDAYYAGNDKFSPNNEFHFGRSRYNQQSQVLQWTEDKLIARHRNDKLYDKEASFSHKRVSRHEYATLKSVHDEALVDDKQIKQHRCRMIREGSIRDFVCTNSKIIHSSKHEQTVLRCRKSIDLFVVEGKSPGRCSKAKSVMCDGSLEKVNQDRDKEREDIKQSQAENLVEPDIPNIESNLGCEKWLDKYPVTECNEALDLEEGQILTDERDIEVPKEINKASESASVTGHMKKSISNKEIAAEGNKVVGGVDNHRILETLAKMEKRRERFKEPITIKKDSEKNPKPQVDPVVEIAESIQLRPARKRRWGGS